MLSRLQISVGQCSVAGRKAQNQDYSAFCLPKEPQLALKGAALALADGIGSSPVSQVASATAVNSFLNDYFCTPEAWSVRHAAECVLSAINSWLHSQTRRSEYRFDRDRGYVCTFSALIVKARTLHLLHIGDSRIYRIRNQTLELLTKDHRLWLSEEESYLSRALGMEEAALIDYQALPLQQDDIYLLASDGVYEFVDPGYLLEALQGAASDLDVLAQRIVQQALEAGSDDNLTVQLLRIDALPGLESGGWQQQTEQLPLAPPLEPRQCLDGYRIERTLHASSRSHVYLVVDELSGEAAVMKTPSIDLGEDAAYLERFLLEEWVARRIDNAHVLRAAGPERQRTALYTLMEYVEGQTLEQWLIDHPRPDLETVRSLIEQLARGLRAFHRLEMLHQDLRPANILIDPQGTVKIIDFGAVQVAGLAEIRGEETEVGVPGTALYAAPEYFLGQGGTPASDLYSLGVIAYHLLSGRFPYGTQVAKARSATAQRRLQYRSVRDEDSELPAWLDATLKRAVHPDPGRRYSELSEFIYDLRHPNPAYLSSTRAPLIERDPVLVWQLVSLCLLLWVLYLLSR